MKAQTFQCRNAGELRLRGWIVIDDCHEHGNKGSFNSIASYESVKTERCLMLCST